MKRLASILISVLVLSVCNTAFAKHFYGVAGPNADFELDTETGILRIYGSGEMNNFHGSWTYYASYSQYDNTGNGVTGKQNGAQYTGSSPLDREETINGITQNLRTLVKSVIIEDGITSIGAAFFFKCTKLTSVSMPASVKLINYEAFRGCTSLETIEIGAGVEKIMGRWATECTKFNYISVHPNNTHFVSVNGVLYTEDLKILVCFPEALNTIEYVIPEGTVYAATDALYHLRLVQSITIPTTMKDIEYGSFDQCPSLKTLVLKASTPPTLHKSMAGTTLTGIYVPCGQAATYSSNGNWSSYGGGNIQNAVVVEFYVSTNNIELGDVAITSRADCEGYKMTITAQPTIFGTFDHWDDGNTQNPRTIEIDKNDLSKIYRYKAIFNPKPYTVTLKKGTEKLTINGREIDVKGKYQVKATKGTTTVSTTGNNIKATSPSNTFFYGDTISIVCDITTGEGIKFFKWDGNYNGNETPHTLVIKETGSYTGKKEFTAEVTSGDVTIYAVSNDESLGTVSPASQTVPFGSTVTIEAFPKAKCQLSYWSDDHGNKETSRTILATADNTYTAYFAKLTYTITASANDPTMGSVSGYGTFEVDKTTTLKATANAHYEFVEWNDGVKTASRNETVTENKNFTAIFRPVKYNITFKNADGTTLATIPTDYNTTAVYSGATPEKEADAQYTYEHTGWSPALTTVTGAATYTATFTGHLRSYEIVFQNEGGAELEKKTIAYGTMPTYTGSTPTKDADVQYTYTFNGWTPTIALVTGAKTYTATFSKTLNKYTIRFLNNGNPLQDSKWEYGTMPTFTGSTPTKSATAQYTYTFSGWSPSITTVTGAKDYEAQFSSTVNKYTILFKNYDGTTLLTLEDKEYGASVDYTGATPTKPATDKYSYTFKGWDSEITTVNGAKTYTATFDETINQYMVTFKNHDGSELQKSNVDYGEMPVYNGATPTRAQDGANTYTFSGWSPDLEAVTGEVTYTAQFSTTANLYTITFNNWDNTKITDKQYEWDEMPSYTGTDPTRPADAQYTYTFSGWTPTIAKVSGNKTYTATYNTTVNTYNITFLDDDNSTLKVLENVPYGETPDFGTNPTKQQTAQYTYTFAGWTPAITSVTGDETYKATYNSTVRSYTITFANLDGKGLTQTQTKNYGEMPVEPATPTKADTDEYTYEFDKWDKTIIAVEGDATYTALFKETKKKYTVQFVNWDDNVLQSSEWEYGQSPSYAGTDPTKESDIQYNYTWTHSWDKEIETVKGNIKYTATFTPSLRSYVITFVNDDNSVLDRYEVAYGFTPEYTGATPTKPQTDEFTFNHSGWDPEIESVAGDQTYKATFSSTFRKYTIIFKDENGELQNTEVSYGTTPVYTGEAPTKPQTAQYTYFWNRSDGWDKPVRAVDGNETYTAKFEAETRSYQIVFLNYNGDILYQSNFMYGQTPKNNGDAPVKPSDATNTYTFVGWNPDITSVTGEATYTAEFSNEAVLYTITFKDYDGSTIDTKKYGYNATITHSDPVRLQDDHFSYTFAGWSPAFASVTADAEYTATYNSIVRQYPITFVIDGVPQQVMTDYGEIPTAPANPTKTETDEFTYTFSGWQPELATVTGEASYTANFTPITRKYAITFLDYDGTEITTKEVLYGETPAIENPSRPADAEFTYTFQRWEPTLLPVTGAGTYTAQYSTTINQYTVTASSADVNMGSVSGSGTYNYNEDAAFVATAQTGYHFDKWNDESTTNPRIERVTGAAEYIAYFAPNTNTPYTLNIYTQNIENDDYQLETRPMEGTTNQLTNYDAPARIGFELQNYEQVIVKGDGSSTLSVYYNRNIYNLTWNANGGNDLTGSYTNGTVKYQTPITQPTAERAGFEFSGWKPNLETMPAEDIECMAQWTEKGDTPYKIEHWLQNLDGETYALDSTDTSKTGKTNATTSVAAIIYEGFTAEPEKTINCSIAADGSSAAKIYYKRNQYMLRWIVDGNELTEDCTNGLVSFGAPVSAPANPEKAGYTFDGWNSAVVATMPANDIDYVAKWATAVNTYVVEHYQQQLDGSYPVMPNIADTLSGITDSTTEASAKVFEGFTANEFEQCKIMADGSTTVAIKYSRNLYTLAWNIGDDVTVGSTPYTEAGEIMFGTQIQAPVLEKVGYTFTWDTLPETMPTSDITCTAIWAATNTIYTIYHIQQDLNGDYSAITETESLIGLSGATTQAEAKEYIGFTANTFEQDSISPDGSTIINILYSRNSYTLTWLADSTSITDSCTNGSVLFGTEIVAPQSPEKQGFTFAGWNADVPETMPAADLTFTATWTIKIDSIVPDSIAHDSVTLDTLQYIVAHYKQNLDSSYTLAATDTLIGIADSLTAAVALTFEGFSAQAFEQVIIVNSVSPTVVNINYIRNKYELKWELNGGTIISSDYTKAGPVAYGTPIVAPDLELKDYAYIWETMPETMPANDITLSPIWTPGPIDEHFDFTVPQVFNGCENMSIEVTNCQTTNVKFEWSINGVVDKSQTGPTFNFPKDAPVSGVITVTGTAFSEKGSSSWSHEIPYTLRKNIITTMWDDVITVVDTAGEFESFKWYHNDVFVSDKAYYCEEGGLTGNYYLIATTSDGDEYNSCAQEFTVPEIAAIKAYPNPTTDKIRVQAGNWKAGDHLTITDGNGKIWRSTIVSNPDGEEFDLSDLPQGIYTIKVGSESVNVIKL